MKRLFYFFFIALSFAVFFGGTFLLSGCDHTPSDQEEEPIGAKTNDFDFSIDLFVSYPGYADRVIDDSCGYFIATWFAQSSSGGTEYNFEG